MPIIPTYPGVYIEEIPSGVRTITGVATSIAAFVGYFPQGLMDKAVQIFNMGDFEREFGGLNSQSEASYAIQQFFLNGGTEAWVVRTASGNVAASTVEILSGIDGATAITLEAGQNQFENPGTWGDNLRVNIDYPAPISGDSFNMTISLVDIVNGQEVVARSEVFNRLTMASVRDVVNDEFSGSKLMRVIDTGGSRPLQTGTVSGGPLAPFPTITNSEPELTVTIGTEGQGIARLSKVPTSLSDARSFLESAIRTARPELRAFAQATVSIVDNRLRILAGPTSANSQVTFSATTATDPTVNLLGLLSSTTLEGLVSGDLDGVFGGGAVSGSLQVNIGSSGPITLTLGAMNNLEEARNELETSIRDESGNTSVAVEDTDAFANARVVTYTDGSEEHLIVLAGVPDRAISFTQDGSDTTVGTLQLDNSAATPITAQLSEDITPVPTISSGSSVDITIGSNGPHTATTVAEVNTLGAIASQLETVFRSADSGNSPAFAGVRVATYSAGGQNRLVVLAGISGNPVVFAPTVLDNTTVNQLLLTGTGVEANVQSYAAGAAIAGTAQGAGNLGDDGIPPDGEALMGEQTAKTGINALLDVDLFNILCIPRTAMISEAPEALAVITAAQNFCEDRRAFFLLDTPTEIDEVQEIKDWLDNNSIPRSKNSALYFPRVSIPDPLNDFKLRSIGASGTIAGLYARIDSNRGVWKAPAGTEATLSNVFKLDKILTDPENGTLNKVAINCLRTFPIYGSICWGARTLEGVDEIGSEWKYVPVRRLALFIEETLFRGLKWVVFEPNDEPLWAQIRLNVGAFMQNLFRQGAFQGQTPRQAYLVKCDRETTTQNDIDRGIVNILVGFAPLKPAEFVFIQLQQLAGQIQI